jgi:hypothetical protein
MNGIRSNRKPRNIDVIKAQSKVISEQADMIEKLRKVVNYLNVEVEK